METVKTNNELYNSKKVCNFDEIDNLMLIIRWINEKHRLMRDLIIFIIAYRFGIKGFCFILEIVPSIIGSLEGNGISCINLLKTLFEIYAELIMVFKLCLVCNILKFTITKTIQFFKSSNL